MKLKTKIEHSFDIDPGLLENLDFFIPFQSKKSMKVKIKILKIKNKIKNDTSTRLF